VIVLLLLEGLMRRDISMPIKERIYQVAFVFLVLFAAMVIFTIWQKLCQVCSIECSKHFLRTNGTGNRELKSSPIRVLK